MSKTASGTTVVRFQPLQHVERERHQRPVQHDGGADDGRGRQCLGEEIARGHSVHVTEEERGVFARQVVNSLVVSFATAATNG